MRKDIFNLNWIGHLHFGGVAETFLSARTTRAAPHTKSRRLSIGKRYSRSQGRKQSISESGPPGVSFVPAVAALDEFPIEVWERSEQQVSHKRERIFSSMRQPCDPEVAQGVGKLICATYRGARCDPDQIIITAGTSRQ